MRILGIDYGDRRTGVAVSDPLGWTAQGLEAIVGDMDHAARRVASLAAEYGASAIVLGYPLNMDGTAGPRAARTDAFARRLAQHLGGGEDDGVAGIGGGGAGGGVAIIRWDERLTTVQATRVLREAGGAARRDGARGRGTGADGMAGRRRQGAKAKPGAARKGAVDIVSAAILLQSYLDSRAARPNSDDDAAGGSDASDSVGDARLGAPPTSGGAVSDAGGTNSDRADSKQ